MLVNYLNYPLFIDIGIKDFVFSDFVLDIFRIAEIVDCSDFECLHRWLVDFSTQHHICSITDTLGITKSDLSNQNNEITKSRAFKLKTTNNHANQFNWFNYATTPTLYSVGSIFPNIKKKKNAVKLVSDRSKLWNKWLSNLEAIDEYRNYFVLDSGGYQATMGYIPAESIPQFCQNYYDFVVELAQAKQDRFKQQSSKFLFGFHLDLLSDWSDEAFIKLNKYTVKQIFENDRYSRGLKDYLVMVFQMLGHPKVHRFWTKLFDEYDIWNNFSKFSIGGIVAFGSPFTSRYSQFFQLTHFTYVLGQLFRKRRADNPINNLHYHVLGVANPYAVVLWLVLGKFIPKYFNTPNFLLTYDSSQFKMLMKYRRFILWSIKDDKLLDLGIKSRMLNNPNQRAILNKQMIKHILLAVRGLYKEEYTKCSSDNIFGTSEYIQTELEFLESKKSEIDRLAEKYDVFETILLRFYHPILAYYAYKMLYVKLADRIFQIVDTYLPANRTQNVSILNLQKFVDILIEEIYKPHIVQQIKGNRFTKTARDYAITFINAFLNLDDEYISQFLLKNVPPVLNLELKEF